jgi:hypothetical protein
MKNTSYARYVIGHETLPLYWGHFEFLRKFAEIFAALCFSPLSTITAIRLLPVLPAINYNGGFFWIYLDFLLTIKLMPVFR